MARTSVWHLCWISTLCKCCWMISLLDFEFRACDYNSSDIISQQWGLLRASLYVWKNCLILITYHNPPMRVSCSSSDMYSISGCISWTFRSSVISAILTCLPHLHTKTEILQIQSTQTVQFYCKWKAKKKDTKIYLVNIT